MDFGLMRMNLQLFWTLGLAACCQDLPVDNVASTSAATSGRISLTMSGLPSGTSGQVIITGPNAYVHTVTASTTLDTLRPGEYALQVLKIAVGMDLYDGTVSSQSVTVAAGDTKQIQVNYGNPARTASIILPAHPRVWLTPARLTFVRAQAAANTSRWQRVKAAADAQLPLGAGGDPELIPDLCLAYLVTGDARYAQVTGAILTQYAVPSRNSQSGSAYPYRYDVPIVTKGLDWCYAGLTVAQRQQAATWLMDHADWVWQETNPSRVGAWGVTDVANNYYWGFMMTGPAALAAAGDDTGTGTISGSDRPAYHQQLALNHWTNNVVPFLSTGDAGGAWQEGTGYDSNGRIAMFADAFNTVGIPLTHPVFNSILRWRFASTMPGFAFHVPTGDQARVSDGRSYWYDRIAVENVMAVADATLSAQAQGWLNALGQVPIYENSYGDMADEVIRYNPNAPTADMTGIPLDYFAAGSGVFLYRQSWTNPTTTAWVFQAGPLQGHNAGAGNSLRIWKGGYWISGDANIYSNSGIEQDAADYNTLTVGGAGQNQYAGSQIFGAPQVSSTLVAVRGQAKDAYLFRDTNPVSDYLRTVAYMPQQDAFVIVDRATAANPSQAKVWRWHTQGMPTISGNTFTLYNPAGDQRCVGTLLSPSDVVLGTQTFSLGSGGAASSNAVTVTLSAGRASDVVVTVLQCGQDTTVPTVLTNGTSTAVTIGTHRVMVPTDPTLPVGYEAASIIHD